MDHDILLPNWKLTQHVVRCMIGPIDRFSGKIGICWTWAVCSVAQLLRFARPSSCERGVCIDSGVGTESRLKTALNSTRFLWGDLGYEKILCFRRDPGNIQYFLTSVAAFFVILHFSVDFFTSFRSVVALSFSTKSRHTDS